MTELDLKNAVLNAIAIMKDDNPPSKKGPGGGHTPRDLGNLADHGILHEQLSPWEWRVYIDLKVAPYMVYLNEDPKNRHYQWFQAQAEKFAGNLANQLGGVLK